jgi:hypothetical protein
MIAVRVLHGGRAVREQLFPALPLTVGRDPASDVVLFDPSVSRRHARIERDENGILVVRDLDSRNGVHLGPVAVDHAEGARFVRCLVGRVGLEVEALTDEPTREIPLTEVLGFEQRRTATDHVRYVALGTVAWLLTAVTDSDFWSPWQPNRSGALLSHVLGAAAGLPMMALVLLGLLRLVGRHVRIADTLRALAVVVAAFAAVHLVGLALYYVLSVPAYGAVTAAMGIASTVWAIVYLAGVRREGPKRWFRLAWVAGALLLSGGLAVTSRLEESRAGQPDVDHVVLPPLRHHAGPARSLERHFAEVQAESEAAMRKAKDVLARHDQSRGSAPDEVSPAAPP